MRVPSPIASEVSNAEAEEAASPCADAARRRQAGLDVVQALQVLSQLSLQLRPLRAQQTPILLIADPVIQHALDLVQGQAQLLEHQNVVELGQCRAL